MADLASRESYPVHVDKLRQSLEPNEALRDAIGGEFVAVGMLEFSLLLSLGLTERDLVVDIGCGSGRLAYQLAALRDLRYVGTDLVPDLLDHARRVTERPDWSFQLAEGTTIPCADGQADFVCFFSVFTHLTHEQTFYYLQEARRALKPGGRIVFTFLEFRIPCHWEIFEHSLRKVGSGLHLNQFMDRDGIRIWAEKLGLEIDLLAEGDKPHIPLAADVVWENGRIMSGLGNLGQSVAVLRLPQAAADRTPGGGAAGAVPRPALRTWEPVLGEEIGRQRERRIAELDEIARNHSERVLELEAERRTLRAMWSWRLMKLERQLRRFFAPKPSRRDGK
jgi:SAM-dependent methyltransferase